MDSFNRNSAVLYICLGISFIYLPGYIALKMNWYKRKSLNSLNFGVIWDFYYPFDKHPRLYISIFRWDLQIVISGKFHNSQDSWTVFITYKSLLWVFPLVFQDLHFARQLNCSLVVQPDSGDWFHFQACKDLITSIVVVNIFAIIVVASIYVVASIDVVACIVVVAVSWEQWQFGRYFWFLVRCPGDKVSISTRWLYPDCSWKSMF